MSCDTLPNTGIAHLGLSLAVALVLLTAGGLALWFARSRRAASAAALLVVLILVGGMAFTSETPAPAATSDCVTSENSLTITQTSTMQDLAPGIAPVAITGNVVNNGPDSTFIAAIDVEITSVTGATDFSPGGCDPSDYTLFRKRMPVGQTLPPGGSASFSGATIGFNDKATNQDACKHAIIHLRYTTVRQ